MGACQPPDSNPWFQVFYVGLTISVAILAALSSLVTPWQLLLPPGGSCRHPELSGTIRGSFWPLPGFWSLLVPPGAPPRRSLFTFLFGVNTMFLL